MDKTFPVYTNYIVVEVLIKNSYLLYSTYIRSKQLTYIIHYLPTYVHIHVTYIIEVSVACPLHHFKSLVVF